MYKSRTQRRREGSHVTWNRRVIIIAIIFAAWFVIIVMKQLDLQVRQRDVLLEKKDEQQKGVITLIPKRGDIYDRNGRILASSLDVDSIYAVPYKIENPAKTARELAKRLNLGYEFVLKKITSKRTFVWIKRKVEPNEARLVTESDLPGIYSYKETKRYYPHGNLASNLIGFAGIDNEGLAGIEYEFDKVLRGKPGAIFTLKDARRKSLSTGQLIKSVPTQGKDIYLTIDSIIQHYLEEALISSSIKHQVKKSFGIVMNPSNGEILALASYPNYDLNRYYQFSSEVQKNLPVHNGFEPGSTFKLVTAAAALDQGKVDLDNRFDCENGMINFAGQNIKDYKPFGVMTMEDILVYSSNIGMIKIGSRIGKELFHNKLSEYGFGKKTGVSLPGENPGILRDLKQWTPLSVGSISFGQEIGINTIQLALFVSAIANGGFLNKPVILGGIGKFGNHPDEDRKGRRILSSRTAKELVDVMEQVVLRGTGRKASVENYLAAGKTGTAQKAGKAGTYIDGAYVSSFIGFIPVDDPAVLIFIVFDEPRGMTDGGDVAAPVFKQVASRIIRYLNVVPLNNPPFFHKFNMDDRESRDYLLAEFNNKNRNYENLLNIKMIESESITSNLSDNNMKKVVIPNLIGRSYKEVFELLTYSELKPVLNGSGIAFMQDPPAGTHVSPGTYCMVSFSRRTNL